MQTLILHVGGMACAHCVKAVTGALTALPGVEAAAVDLAAGTATVEHDPVLAPPEKLKEAIEEQGYDVDSSSF
ncbi:MAG: cation transporter [Firmicutes bacterium]|nr:cation transporter [Bacillota bacterium]